MVTCKILGQFTSVLYIHLVSRTGPTVGNDDEGEIERRGDYQTSEGVDERVDERVDCES